jgi:hypothetical protein
VDDFRLLTVREIDPSLPADPDGLLFPLPAERADDIVLEPRDGKNVLRMPVKAATLYFKPRGGEFGCVAGPLAMPSCLIVTDARIAFACSKYDKGSTWIGTPGALNLALNAASAASAAIRRHGKMLVGQIRYPYLGSIFGRRKKGLMGEEQIRVMTVTPDHELVRLDLVLKGGNALTLAGEVVRRAARYNLSCGFVEAPDTLEKLERLTRFAALPDDSPKLSAQVLPGAQFVAETSARLSPLTSALASTSAAQQWKCASCGILNDSDQEACRECDVSRPFRTSAIDSM